MRSIYLVVLIMAAILTTGACAATYTDSFTGTTINTAMWEVRSNNGVTTSQNNALFVNGSNTTNIDWGANGSVRSRWTMPAEGLEVAVDMSASGVNYWAGMWLTDGSNHVNFFTSGHLPPVGYTYVVNGVPTFNVRLANTPGTRYMMRYSGGAVSFYLDGQYLGQQVMPFSGNVQVALEGCTALQGNTVSARFDNFSATTVPEPSSLLMLLSGLGGVGGTMLRRRRS